MGSKSVSDLIGEDCSIDWQGTDGSVTGEVKFVEDYSDLFGKAEQSGNFFPLVLDDSYEGKPITVQRKGGKAYTTADTEWIMRLSDQDKTEYDISCEGTKIAHLTFSEAALGVPVTVIPQDHNLGKYKKDVKELVTEDTKINPDGSVTGTLKHIEGWEEVSQDVEKRTGNFLPVRLDSQYMGKTVKVQGKDKTTDITVSADTDRDIIIRVTGKDAEFTFSENGVQFLKLTFKETVLQGS